MWDSKEYLGYLNGTKLNKPWCLLWRIKNLSVGKGILEIEGRRKVVKFAFRMPTNSPHEHILEMWTIEKYKPISNKQLFKEMIL